MPSGLMSSGFAVAGVRAAAGCGGLYRKGRNDMALFEVAAGATCAGVFTTNTMAAAPVHLCKTRIAGLVQPLRAFFVSAGQFWQCQRRHRRKGLCRRRATDRCGGETSASTRRACADVFNWRHRQLLAGTGNAGRSTAHG